MYPAAADTGGGSALLTPAAMHACACPRQGSYLRTRAAFLLSTSLHQRRRCRAAATLLPFPLPRLLPCAAQMYLTDVEEGGETVFPHVPKLPHQTKENGWSNCSLQVCDTNLVGMHALRLSLCPWQSRVRYPTPDG
jgi:hypothetical protein